MGPRQEGKCNPDDQQDSGHISGCELQLPPLPVPGRTCPGAEQAEGGRKGAHRSATRYRLEVICPLHSTYLRLSILCALELLSLPVLFNTGLPLRVVRMYLLTDGDIINRM